MATEGEDAEEELSLSVARDPCTWAALRSIPTTTTTGADHNEEDRASLSGGRNTSHLVAHVVDRCAHKWSRLVYGSEDPARVQEIVERITWSTGTPRRTHHGPPPAYTTSQEVEGSPLLVGGVLKREQLTLMDTKVYSEEKRWRAQQREAVAREERLRKKRELKRLKLSKTLSSSASPSTEEVLDDEPSSEANSSPVTTQTDENRQLPRRSHSGWSFWKFRKEEEERLEKEKVSELFWYGNLIRRGTLLDSSDGDSERKRKRKRKDEGRSLHHLFFIPPSCRDGEGYDLPSFLHASHYGFDGLSLAKANEEKEDLPLARNSPSPSFAIRTHTAVALDHGRLGFRARCFPLVSPIGRAGDSSLDPVAGSWLWDRLSEYVGEMVLSATSLPSLVHLATRERERNQWQADVHVVSACDRWGFSFGGAARDIVSPPPSPLGPSLGPTAAEFAAADTKTAGQSLEGGSSTVSGSGVRQTEGGIAFASLRYRNLFGNVLNPSSFALSVSPVVGSLGLTPKPTTDEKQKDSGNGIQRRWYAFCRVVLHGYHSFGEFRTWQCGWRWAAAGDLPLFFSAGRPALDGLHQSGELLFRGWGYLPQADVTNLSALSFELQKGKRLYATCSLLAFNPVQELYRRCCVSCPSPPAVGNGNDETPSSTSWGDSSSPFAFAFSLGYSVRVAQVHPSRTLLFGSHVMPATEGGGWRSFGLLRGGTSTPVGDGAERVRVECQWTIKAVEHLLERVTPRILPSSPVSPSVASSGRAPSGAAPGQQQAPNLRCGVVWNFAGIADP